MALRSIALHRSNNNLPARPLESIAYEAIPPILDKRSVLASRLRPPKNPKGVELAPAARTVRPW